MTIPLPWLLAVLWIAWGLTASAPGIVGGDSPELAAAAFHWGPAHAPGYPLYGTLGHLFLSFPLGSPAFRLNLLSIVAQALAFLVLTDALARMDAKPALPKDRRLLSILTSCLVMAGPLVFRQSTGPEVFALHFLFVSILLNQLLTKDSHPAGATALVLGLALSHQHLSLLLVPALFLVLRKALSEEKTLFFSASLLLVGLSPYLATILRANLQPPVNWGHPNDLLQFMDHLLRTQYGGDLTSGPWKNGFLDLYLYLKDWFLESWGLAPLLAFLGLWKNREGLGKGYFTGLSCLGLLLPFLIRGNYDPENNHINEAFLPPAFLWAAPLVLRGLEWSFLRFPRPQRALSFGAAILALSLAAASHHRSDATRDLALEDQARNILLQMPARSVLFSSGDAITFPLAYLKLVLGLRPDVEIYDRTGGLFPNIYHLLDHRSADDPAPPPFFLVERQIENTHHPSAVFYTEKGDAAGVPTAKAGLLFKELEPGQEGRVLDAPWDLFRVPRVGKRHDYLSRETAARFYLFKAAYEWDVLGKPMEGEECLAQAEETAYDNSRVFLNAGVEENGRLLVHRAARSFQRSSELTPWYFLSWYDRGLVAETQRDFPLASSCFKKAVKLNPSYTDAHQHLGFQYYQAGQFEKAVGEWETVRRLDPNYTEVYRTLGYVYMQHKPEYATQMFQHYLMLAPHPPDEATLRRWIADHPAP